MEIVIKFILSILELCTYILFSYFILHSKITLSLKKTFLIFFVYSILYFSIHIFTPRITNILELSLYFIVYTFISEGTLFYKLKIFSIAWLIAGFIDILLFTSFTIMFNVERNFLSEFLSILCINTVWVILSPLTKKYIVKRSVVELPKTIYLNILITCFSCSMVLMILILFSNNLNMPVKLTIVSITLVTLSLSIITVYQFLQSDNLKYLYLEKSKFLEQELKLQKEYFSSIYEQYKTIRAINHDINAHTFCIKNLLENKNYDGLQEYLNELTQKSIINSKSYYCADTYISAILYNLSPRLKERNIDFDFVYLLATDMLLTPTEKSSLFYNLISNSIEACEKVNGNRKIKLIIESTLSNVLITVQNTVNDDTCLDNFIERKTSKQDTIFHGIGLSNIDAIIKKYDGTMQATYIDECFNISILLYNSLK